MIVYDLKVNGIINPIGYDFKDIIVSWSIGETKAIRLKSVNVRVSVNCTHKSGQLKVEQT